MNKETKEVIVGLCILFGGIFIGWCLNIAVTGS